MGLAKLTIDKYLKYYYNSHGLEYASLRFANVFGPRQDPKGEAGVVALFFEKLKAGEPAHVFGTGEQTRDFVYVADVVDSIVKSMKVSVNTYLNIGTGSEISINQLYSEQAQVVGSEIEPVNDPAVPGELMRNCLDATQAKDVLSWQPQVSIQQGLEQTWEWFKNKKS